MLKLVLSKVKNVVTKVTKELNLFATRIANGYTSLANIFAPFDLVPGDMDVSQMKCVSGNIKDIEMIAFTVIGYLLLLYGIIKYVATFQNQMRNHKRVAINIIIAGKIMLGVIAMTYAVSLL